MKTLLTACAALLLTCPCVAEDWPGWRGPRGDGSSFAANPPLKWNGPIGTSIRWKVQVPGTGHASPIVSGNRIFLVSCDKKTKERLLICMNRTDGRKLWQRTVLKSPLESKHNLNSYASSTPATDGTFVYTTFLEVDGRTVPAPNVGRPRPITPGEIVVAAHNLDGERIWTSRPGEFVSAHGFCSSPILYKNLVIINGDHDGDSYVVALDKKTGKQVWKVAREHKTRSYVTPIIRDVAGRTQMVFSGSECVVSLNPADGSPFWKVDGPTEQFVASMVFDGKKFYLAAGYPTHHVMAIRPDGSGNVSDSHVAWHQTNARCYVPSPVVVGNYLIVADDRGTANCFDTESGNRLWQARLGKHYSASLITAGGLVYFLADDGVAKIVRPGATVDVVAENILGEYCFASPAIAGDQLFIRAEKHLYCIEEAVAESGP